MNNTKNLFAVRIVSLVVCIAAVFSLFAPQASAEEFGAVAGSSAILLEPSSGEILYEYNSNTPVMPASTTKVMTALLVMEAAKNGSITLDDEVTATQAIIDGVIYDASKVMPYIADGEIMTVREYLYCVLVESDCVACDILANYVSGSVQQFVAEMNTRAKELGCKNTVFVNTHGYPVDGHFSTAYDLALICAEAIKYDEFKEIFGTIKYSLPATNLTEARMLYNTNWLLWNPEKITSIYCKYFYEFATGGKTGSSSKSGHCLVSTAQKNDMELICVITGCEIANPSEGQWVNMSFSESARLYEWGFANFTHQKALTKGSTHASIAVKKSEIEEMGLVAADDVSLTVPVGSEGLISTEVVVYNDTVKAPVSAGDVMGEVRVIYKGEVVSTVNLLASREAPVKEGINPVLVILIILVVAMAGVMLYVVNSDDPVILKKYKPQYTYRDKSRSQVSPQNEVRRTPQNRPVQVTGQNRPQQNRSAQGAGQNRPQQNRSAQGAGQRRPTQSGASQSRSGQNSRRNG